MKPRWRKPAARLLALFAVVLTATACGTNLKQDYGQDVGGTSLTVGTVQREIHVGMSGDEVVRVLGSPNIVTTDELRREVWVYDKISTETAFSTIEGGVRLLKFAVAASGGKTSTTQKTLTVVVKYDDVAKVRDFAYHYSKF